MPFTDKMKQQIKKGSLKVFAFNCDPSPEELKLLDEYFWDFPNATKRVLRDNKTLYLVQRKKVEPLNMSSLMSSLDDSVATDGVDIDGLNEILENMGGGKKRKTRKNMKNRKIRKTRKIKKEIMGWQKW